MHTALTCVAAIAACVAVVAGVLCVYGLLLAAARPTPPDPVDQAYDSLPAGRPELHVDTSTGDHDRYPHMTDNVRRIVTDYCEAMWQHSTQEQP